ncbi:hypothetical protein BCR33DRAFT_723238 [Rhizoclosmatium globosum]|uniref:Uncharacterized protein n=1 Tax=Rhizoclosmatium globosum TaxID=329046 RepID=A0A1Y2BES3_9FUNG|nr:hypothetical protein BCR33DRAFT_723238 [Rhizoclosmatium globosum]|eukprot:ORY33264.1 hypothetical protein BCR33DRAFT_723238 [Rhizoclosmatium globosum]
MIQQRLILQFRVLHTPNILSLPNRYDALIVPTNKYLVGCRLPYITKGATYPSHHPTKLYPIQSVDGSVHAEAGPHSENVKCPTGSAVVTPSFGLEKRFSVLVHTAVPIDAVRAKFPTDALKIATVLIGSGSQVYRILLEAKRRNVQLDFIVRDESQFELMSEMIAI